VRRRNDACYERVRAEASGTGRGRTRNNNNNNNKIIRATVGCDTRPAGLVKRVIKTSILNSGKKNAVYTEPVRPRAFLLTTVVITRGKPAVTCSRRARPWITDVNGSFRRSRHAVRE